MPSGGVETPIPASVFARLAAATRFVIAGAGPESWFGPQQPLLPQAPAEVKGRQWDYPFGVNINYVPRSDNALSFHELRALSEALPLMRAVIETRKDQIAALNWTVRPRLTGSAPGADQRSAAVRDFLGVPDRRHDFATWIRMLVEDMLVVDAATIYPRYTRSGAVFSLDIVDGATIKPLIGEDGRSPAPPDPAYQQVLHGVPAADFGSDELLYLPRNVRSHRIYGFSPVEQIALTVNIALRREQATLDYYNTGSIPDSFATLPKDWTLDQIRQFQDYFDALMSGNLARRRMVKFMPSEFKLTETRQPPLKDMYDEWLARVICYAFSVPASAFVSQVNRATSETLRAQAATEGLVPLKAWVKMVFDRVIAVGFGSPDCEFCWVGDDAVDPLQQAQTIAILVGAGVKTVAEARVELGLGRGAGVVKFNSHHDELGLFTTAEGAVESGGPRPLGPDHGVQVAEIDSRRSNPGVMSDVNSRPSGIEAPTQSGGIEVAAGNPRPPYLGVDKYAVRLGEEETYWGGHGVKDHIAIPKDQLTSELLKTAQPSPDGGFAIKQSGEGSYTSISDANDLVNRILERNQTACDMVASGQWDSDWLNVRFGYSTGYEAFVTPSGDIQIRTTYNAGVNIVHDSRVPRGYRVDTTYPNNKHDAND